MRILKIEINCGEATCTSVPGKFCGFMGARRFGTQPLCLLFPEPNPGRRDPGAATLLESKEGWLQRCPACLEAEEK